MRKLTVIQAQAVSQGTTLRQQIDQEWRARTLGSKKGPTRVACHKGCSSCCYHPVFVTLLEGLRIYRSLVTKMLWSPKLRAKVEEHSNLTLGLNPGVWALSMIPCPFLEGSTCGIYSMRPLSCRVTLATGDPYYCHPHRLTTAHTSILDRSHVQQDLQHREGPISSQIGLPHMPLPLSSCLVIIAGWHQGDQSLEDLGCQIQTLIR